MTVFTRHRVVHCDGADLQMLGDENTSIKLKHLIRGSSLHCAESFSSVAKETENVPFTPPQDCVSTPSSLEKSL